MRVKFLNGHIWVYAHLQYSHFLVIFKNMPICNMPIFLKIHKYAHLWYAHFFQKMGIFQNQNMPKKKTYGFEAPSALSAFSGLTAPPLSRSTQWAQCMEVCTEWAECTECIEGSDLHSDWVRRDYTGRQEFYTLFAIKNKGGVWKWLYRILRRETLLQVVQNQVEFW